MKAAAKQQGPNAGSKEWAKAGRGTTLSIIPKWAQPKPKEPPALQGTPPPQARQSEEPTPEGPVATPEAIVVKRLDEFPMALDDEGGQIAGLEMG